MARKQHTLLARSLREGHQLAGVSRWSLPDCKIGTHHVLSLATAASH
jgi:hypothetical protein